MKKMLSALFAIPMFYLAACSPLVASIPEDADRPEIRGFINRVDYGYNTAYIFGSMHYGLEEWFPLSPIVENAMTSADVFAFEVDFGLAEDPALQERLEELMRLPEGTTLSDLLPSETVELMIQQLADLPGVYDAELFFSNLEEFTPVVVAEYILLNFIMPHIEIERVYSVDYYVLDFATSNNRPIIGLNDIFVEHELLYNVPIDVQITMFDEDGFGDFQAIIDDLMGTDGFDDIVRGYETNDLELFRGDSLVQHSLYDEHRDNVYWNIRCNIFADEIARLLQETEEPTTFFVTIGAGHVAGPGKVLQLLEDMGFDLVPLWQ